MKSKFLIQKFILFVARILLQVFRLCRRLFYTAKIKATCGSYKEGLRVNKKSTVSKNTHLGRDVHFNGMNILGGGKVFIGDHFHSGEDCLFISQNHVYDSGNALPYDTDKYHYKDIIIEDYVWLGSRVIVLGGAVIREGAIIQAGSVVTGEIPRCSITGGNPAKPFKFRNIEHFESLKNI
jgi:chloramphenicol O-acetyltransferase type B